MGSLRSAPLTRLINQILFPLQNVWVISLSFPEDNSNLFLNRLCAQLQQ